MGGLEEMNMTNLLVKLTNGSITLKERGVLVRTIQATISQTLLTSLFSLDNTIAKLNELTLKVLERVEETIEEDIETMDLESSIKVLGQIMDKQLAIAEVQRKVAQGKELFPESQISEEERMILQLFSSFKTEEEKQAFVNIVHKTLGGGEGFE